MRGATAPLHSFIRRGQRNGMSRQAAIIAPWPRERRSAGPSYFLYAYLILPSETSSRDIVK
jgi:hypothetical protein